MLEVFRRFRHFFVLRDILFERFLGLYIPPIPQKKSVVSQVLQMSIRDKKQGLKWLLGEQRRHVCGRKMLFS